MRTAEETLLDCDDYHISNIGLALARSAATLPYSFRRELRVSATSLHCMADGQAARIEQLAVTRFRRYFDQKLPSSQEDEVLIGLQALLVASRDTDSAWRHTQALTRTGTSFVLNGQDLHRIMEAIKAEAAQPSPEGSTDGSMFTDLYDYTTHGPVTMMGYGEDSYRLAWGEEQPYDILDLPPLPYPRLAIELWDEESELPGSFFGTDHGPNERRSLHPLILINETVPSESWDVFCPSVEISAEGQTGESLLFDFRIGSGGRFSLIQAEMAPDNALMPRLDRAETTEQTAPDYARFWRRLVLDIVTLVTARNVPHRQIAIPRGTRRGFERSYKLTMPSAYWVDLAEAGEDQQAAAGREYHVRFLVRGHWRHSERGTRSCSLCGEQASWVRPAAKGPVGAPWKGRPVYRGGLYTCARMKEKMREVLRNNG